MSSRDRILQRLRSSLNAQDNQSVRDPLSVATGWAAPDRALWIESFKQNLSDNHADVIEVTQAQWTEMALAQLKQRGIKTLRCGNHGEGQALVRAVQDFSAAQNSAGAEQKMDAAYVTDAIDKTQVFNDTEAGFSVAMAGLAETGTLVVNTGPYEPRTLSLVPPLNIILLRASNLFASFSALVAAGGLPHPMPTNLLLISGPSKTADIQQTLAYGAHGPKELIVLLVTDV